MGHLVYRHPLQGVIESVGLQTAISAISGNSQSLGEAAGVASMLQQMSYGRNMERAADEAAVKYMGGAGYDPAVFGRFLTKMMDAVEKFFLIEALRDHGNNKTNAAKSLGITREGLHKKLRQYRI